MDDGSSSIEESVAMLQESYRQGVRAMIATPHFYAERDTIDHFLGRRSDRIGRVVRAVGKLEDIPCIHLGAEVLYFQGMSHAEMIPSLCIEQTNNLLLEMPFAQWDESVLREVDRLLDRRKLQVVIAHLDRYLPYQKNPFYLNALLEMPVKIQLNASAFARIRKRTVLKLVKEGRVDALGSDCHNMSNRLPNLKTAAAVIEKKLGIEYLEQIERKSAGLLASAAQASASKPAVPQQEPEQPVTQAGNARQVLSEGARPCMQS
jgi:protein-tyrosine phosphatase